VDGDLTFFFLVAGVAGLGHAAYQLIKGHLHVRPSRHAAQPEVVRKGPGYRIDRKQDPLSFWLSFAVVAVLGVVFLCLGIYGLANPEDPTGGSGDGTGAEE